MVDVVVVEEHHEAFIAWHWKALKAHGAFCNNHLLHVDQHADLVAPDALEPVPTLDSDLKKVKSFVYNNLSIGSFIVPAVYSKLINHVTWLQHSDHNQNNTLEVFRENNTFNISRLLYRETILADGHNRGSDIRASTFNVRHVGWKGALNRVEILDIDLDYFSCNENPWSISENKSVEISKDAYNEILAERYHFIRLNCPFLTPSYDPIKDKYYLAARPTSRTSPLIASGAVIATRVEQLRFFLIEKHVTPSLITLCRSRLSGYTPRDQWQHIENSVIKMLSSLYPLHVVNIDSL